MAKVDLSLIIPILNEETLIDTLYDRVSKSLNSLNLNYEVIVVSDGSTDSSVPKLLDIQKKDSHWKIIELSRNFGHHSACTAGLEHSGGRAIVFMDADLQDPPELISTFVQKWKEGYEVVYGVKSKRKEPFIWRTVFKSFYRVLNFFSSVDMPMDAGVFGLLDRKAADALITIKERHRYLAGLRSWLGFKQLGIPYDRDDRFAGKRQQTITKLVELALDAIFSFSHIPLRIATLIGALFAGFSFFVLIYTIYQKVVTNQALLGWSSLMVAIIMTGGVILFTLGIIGEYLGRIYDEIKQRPIYLIKNTTGFN